MKIKSKSWGLERLPFKLVIVQYRVESFIMLHNGRYIDLFASENMVVI